MRGSAFACQDQVPISLSLGRIFKSRQVLVLVSNKISGLAEVWQQLRHVLLTSSLYGWWSVGVLITLTNPHLVMSGQVVVELGF